jgi:hypothetical protein
MDEVSRTMRAMPTEPAGDIPANAARAIAQVEGQGRILEILLRSIVDGLEVESGAIFVPDPRGGLDLVAAVGLGEPIVADLAAVAIAASR